MAKKIKYIHPDVNIYVCNKHKCKECIPNCHYTANAVYALVPYPMVTVPENTIYDGSKIIRGNMSKNIRK